MISLIIALGAAALTQAHPQTFPRLVSTNFTLPKTTKFNSTSPYPHTTAKPNYDTAAWKAFIGFCAFGVIIVVLALLLVIGMCALKQRKKKKGKKVMKAQRESEYEAEIELQVPRQAHARD